MATLVLAIWASLVSAELTAHPTQAARNLSCYQCFKVSHWTQCQPRKCSAAQRVCISNEVTIFTESMTRSQISKRCAVWCLNSNSLFQWSGAPGVQNRIIRRCCSGHLCNTAPAAQEGLWALLGRLLLPVGLGLLCPLLQGPLSCGPSRPTPTSTSCPPPITHLHPIQDLWGLLPPWGWRESTIPSPHAQMQKALRPSKWE